MKSIIEKFKSIVAQIATPHSVGTGFYLAQHGLIITNEHVVSGNKEVVIHMDNSDRLLMPVVYVDPKLDLAFIQAPEVISSSSVNIANSDLITEGDVVIAAGHPFGLKYTATQGIVSNTAHLQRDIYYIQHDAALNPGNSGGPLLNDQAQIVGVNTFIIQNGQNIGFSLPSNYLQKSIDEYIKGELKSGVRCISCMNIVFEPNVDAPYCPYCGVKIQMISDAKLYQPNGIKKQIESIITRLSYDVRVTRRGPSQWELIHGSAKIVISYHEQSGTISGDAVLSSLPKERIKEIYLYLLQQNYILKGLKLSVQNNEILLSTLMYDQYFHTESAFRVFKNLVEKANEHDDILVQQFGCLTRID